MEILNKPPKNLEVAVYIPDDDVGKFMEFQQHYEIFSLLLDRKVFEQKNCTIKLNFDNKGTLQTIEREDYLYSRRHEDAIGPI